MATTWQRVRVNGGSGIAVGKTVVQTVGETTTQSDPAVSATVLSFDNVLGIYLLATTSAAKWTVNGTSHYIYDSTMPAWAGHITEVVECGWLGERTTPSTDGSRGADNDEASGTFTATEDGTVVEIWHDCKYATSGGGIKLALYSDASGRPDARLAVTGIVGLDSAMAWHHGPVLTPYAITNGTAYWLSYIAEVAIGNCYNSSATGKYTKHKAGAYADGPPNPFPNPPDSGYTNLVRSIAALYQITAAPPAGNRRRRLLLTGRAA